MNEPEVPFDLMLEAARNPAPGYEMPVFHWHSTFTGKVIWKWWKSTNNPRVYGESSKRELTTDELAQWNVALMMANSSE